MGTSTHAARVVPVNRLTDAIVTVDVQPAFMPQHVWDGIEVAAGGLAVRDGHLIVPVVLNVESLFHLRYATLDQHPKGHVSLASSYVGFDPGTLLTLDTVSRWAPPGYVGSDLGEQNRIAGHAKFTFADLLEYLRLVQGQMLWPDHALVGTAEAELHPSLDWLRYRYVQTKGSTPAVDSYSGFFDNAGVPTGLGDRLKTDGVENVFVQGLAEDFCVGWTALGARKLGFKKVFLIEDATKPVDMPGTRDKMRVDLARAGVEIVRSEQLVAA